MGLDLDGLPLVLTFLYFINIQGLEIAPFSISSLGSCEFHQVRDYVCFVHVMSPIVC